MLMFVADTKWGHLPEFGPLLVGGHNLGRVVLTFPISSTTFMTSMLTRSDDRLGHPLQGRAELLLSLWLDRIWLGDFWKQCQLFAWRVLARFAGAMCHRGRPRCEVFEPHAYGTLTPL